MDLILDTDGLDADFAHELEESSEANYDEENLQLELELDEGKELDFKESIRDDGEWLARKNNDPMIDADINDPWKDM